jgi:hypothetical protein
MRCGVRDCIFMVSPELLAAYGLILFIWIGKLPLQDTTIFEKMVTAERQIED